MKDRPETIFADGKIRDRKIRDRKIREEIRGDIRGDKGR